jgi:hypothetical protein
MTNFVNYSQATRFSQPLSRHFYSHGVFVTRRQIARRLGKACMPKNTRVVFRSRSEPEFASMSSTTPPGVKNGARSNGATREAGRRW